MDEIHPITVTGYSDAIRMISAIKRIIQAPKPGRIINIILLPVLFCIVALCSGCTLHDETGLANPYYYSCDPETGNGPIDVSVSASRLGGVAPLSVFFDATGTTGLANKCFFSDNAAYMDATFSWDFDADDNDPDGKFETASGFVAAHVFEDAGTYRVHLEVTDADGDSASDDITIQVTAFSGATYYVAADGDDTLNDGLSTGAPFRTPGRALISSVLGPDVRVLFRNGDTFTIDSMIGVSGETGPIIIGAYDYPEGHSSARPVIHTTAVDSDWSTIHFYDCSDIRIMDIGVRATEEGSFNPRYPFGVSWNYGCTHMLKYRTEEYENGGMAMSPSGRYCTVAECEYHNTTQTGYTSNGEGVNDGNAVIGNWVYDKNVNTTDDTEHIFRLQGGSRYFIAHNRFGPNNLVHYDGLTIRGNSEKVVIYKNRIEGWVQAIWPQNRNSSREYQHHCIMDSNLIVGQGLYENDRQGAIGLHAKDIVIRNNIIYNYQYGVGIGDDTVVGPSQRIKVYNNTFVNPSADDTFMFVNLDWACRNIEVKNNLMLDLAGGNPLYTVFLRIAGGDVFYGESDNNIFYGGAWASDPELFSGSTLAEWQSVSGNDLSSSIADPVLSSVDYNDADFCKPQAGSPLIDAGGFTPNALDFNGNPRDSLRDIGACEYH